MMTEHLVNLVIPVKFMEESGAYRVTFEDYPEIVTQGKSFNDAANAALDALNAHLEGKRSVKIARLETKSMSFVYTGNK